MVDGLPIPPLAVVATMPGVPGTRTLCGERLTVTLDTAPGNAAPGGASRPPPPEGACDTAIHLERLKLTFDDEFDTLRLWDPVTRQGVWKTNFASGPQSGPYAWDSRTLHGNHELEIYVDPAFPGLGVVPLGLNPFEVRDGAVSIVANKTPASLKWRLWDYAYTSGLLTTQPSFSQRYGYFEIRAKLPAGKGMWPAFWLIATDASWPPELDILEQLGGDTIYQTVHTRRNGALDETGFKVQRPGATTGYHTYGALWTANRVVWFIDGKQTASAPTPDDMHKPMYILLNLAVGGNMPGSPDDQTRFPGRYSIDYIRVYSLDPAPPPAAAGPHPRPDKKPGRAAASPGGA